MNSKTTAICAACGAAASSAVAVVALRMARAARRDAALAEAGLLEAQEAASVAAGSRRARRRRTDSREAPAEADGRSRQPPAPSLGLLGIGKLVFVARASAQLILAGYLVDELAHRGLPRGVYRQRARDFCRAAARSVKVTGATTLVVAAAASFKITLRALKALRTRDLPKSSLEQSFAAAAEDIGAELHAWGNKMQNCDLMTHSEGEVGWLLREPGARRIVDQTAEFHRKLRELGDRRGGAKVRRKLLLDVFGSPKVSAVAGRSKGWDAVCVLLVPGLWTKWYPLYWVHLRAALDACAIDYVFSKSDTDLSLEENTKVIQRELRKILEDTDRSVLVYSHSKGCLDVADAVYELSPAEKQRVCGFVSTQGPFGGAILGNDVLKTRVVKGALILLFEVLLGGAGRVAVKDMAYDVRRAYYAAKPERWWVHPGLRDPGEAGFRCDDPGAKDWVPTVCLCSAATHQPKALMAPIVEYYRYRYGADGAIDGLCSRLDTALPGAPCVFLSDMDHFGPAWTGFPALDRYDSVDLFFVLSAMAFHRGTTAARMAKKLKLRPPRTGSLGDDDDAHLADCSEGFQTAAEDSPTKPTDRKSVV